jgi:hypothetical protein
LRRFSFCNPRYEKQQLPLNVRRYGPPSLFITVYGLQWDTEQTRHLRLGFPKLLSEKNKSFALHKVLLKKFCNKPATDCSIPLCSIKIV